ncbi:MAG: F0F1 ATP synthase subunit gamma [Dermatophilaceae bacterium]
MGAQMRVYRQRIRSVQATKKITSAMELMAASRVIKARQRVVASGPYTHALTKALSALAASSRAPHPLTTDRQRELESSTVGEREAGPRRAAVVIITSDRGLAGSYSSAVIKQSESLIARLQDEGKVVVPYLLGRKVISYYDFRGKEYGPSWSGNSDAPTFERAQEIGERLLARGDLDVHESGAMDEVHVVYTRFKTMVTQETRALRLMPVEILEADKAEQAEQADEDDPMPLYVFEPSAEEVMDQLLRKYIVHRIYTCMLGAAASELAARQRAMKSATDNADTLIKTYTRLANQARQAEITQEISEIVGGADALASA